MVRSTRRSHSFLSGPTVSRMQCQSFYFNDGDNPTSRRANFVIG
jgi:hypothetical protein